MKSFFKWLINSFRRQPTAQLPRVSPVTHGHGHSECCVRPIVFAGPRFFIHFLTTGNPTKVYSVADRVGVELADALRQKEFGPDPLRFFFKDLRDSLNNWREQPVISSIREILRNMDIRYEHDCYLATSTYGMPALMVRFVVLDDIVMTVGLSINGDLQEADVLEWHRDNPIPGIVLPKMVLTTEKQPRIGYVQKHSDCGSSIAVLLNPAEYYDMDQAGRSATAIIAIASALYNSLYNRPAHREDYLSMMAIFYSRAWSTFSIKIQPGHYYAPQLGVFAMSLILDDMPPVMLMFLPQGYDIGNLPPFDMFKETMAESLGRPYPIEGALQPDKVPSANSMLVENFHYDQASEHLKAVAKVIYHSVDNRLMHEFTIHDVLSKFGLVECPSGFARQVANACTALQNAEIRDQVEELIDEYRRKHGEVVGLEKPKAYVDSLKLDNRKLENALRDRFASLEAHRSFCAHRHETQRQKAVVQTRTVKQPERQRFSDDWRGPSQTDSAIAQAMVMAAVLTDDTPTHRCDPTPASESVCRDDSPSYSSCDSNPSFD